jgi:CheY-like chemotaxis protein
VELLLKLGPHPKYSLRCPKYSRRSPVFTTTSLEGERKVVRRLDDRSPRGAALNVGGAPNLLTKSLISIVDDDEDFRTSLTDLMQAMGFTVEAFPSAAEFLASPNIRQTSCLIADVHMPLMTGTELHRRLVEWGLAIPTILVSAYPDESVRARALGQGVVCYLSKPLEEAALLGCVRSALQRAGPNETAP